MSKNCIITTVKGKIKGNATSYIEKENEIFIPVSKKFSLKQTRAIAQDKVNSINKEYLSEKFGEVVSLNSSYTDGTGINIHPSQRLVDAYEVKEGNKTIEEVNPRNLEYFNGDEALLEQEQNEDNLIQKELDNIVEQTNNIKENKIPASETKEGVDFVFEQTPELASQIYEALGFDNNKNLNVRNSIVKAYKDKTTIELPLTLLESLIEFDRVANPNRIVPAQLGEKDKLNPFNNIKEMTSRENIDRIKESITKNGFNGYLEISLNSKGALALTEGNHRLQALKELGYTNVPVKVLGRNTVEGEYFQMVENGKTRQYGLNLNKDFNTQITPQQKQQAQQLYSQYLDTIFPDSKVKDILYRLTGKNLDKFEPSKETRGIYASGDINEVSQYSGRRSANESQIYSILMDIRNPLEYRKRYGSIDTSYTNLDQAIKNGNDSIIVTGREGEINEEVAVLNSEQIHILGSKQDIEGFKEFVSKKINNIKADESINERLKKYEESIKIPNNVKSKVLEKIEKETEKVKEKLLSLGFKQEDSKFEFFTNSYTTFKMKLKELDNLNVNLTTNKGDDFYQINARLKTIDSTLELKKQGELPFTPIEIKQTIQEKEFLNEVSDNVFEGLSEEEKQILKTKIENGDYDLNCKI